MLGENTNKTSEDHAMSEKESTDLNSNTKPRVCIIYAPAQPKGVATNNDSCCESSEEEGTMNQTVQNHEKVKTESIPHVDENSTEPKSFESFKSQSPPINVISQSDSSIVLPNSNNASPRIPRSKNNSTKSDTPSSESDPAPVKEVTVLDSPLPRVPRSPRNKFSTIENKSELIIEEQNPTTDDNHTTDECPTLKASGDASLLYNSESKGEAFQSAFRPIDPALPSVAIDTICEPEPLVLDSSTICNPVAFPLTTKLNSNPPIASLSPSLATTPELNPASIDPVLVYVSDAAISKSHPIIADSSFPNSTSHLPSNNNNNDLNTKQEDLKLEKEISNLTKIEEMTRLQSTIRSSNISPLEVNAPDIDPEPLTEYRSLAGINDNNCSRGKYGTDPELISPRLNLIAFSGGNDLDKSKLGENQGGKLDYDVFNDAINGDRRRYSPSSFRDGDHSVSLSQTADYNTETLLRSDLILCDTDMEIERALNSEPDNFAQRRRSLERGDGRDENVNKTRFSSLPRNTGSVPRETNQTHYGNSSGAESDGSRCGSPQRLTRYNSAGDVLKKFSNKWDKTKEGSARECKNGDVGKPPIQHHSIGAIDAVEGSGTSNSLFDGTSYKDYKESSLDTLPKSNGKLPSDIDSLVEENLQLKSQLKALEHSLQDQINTLKISLTSNQERWERTNTENSTLRSRAETDQLKLTRLEDRIATLEASLSAAQTENLHLRDMMKPMNSKTYPGYENGGHLYDSNMHQNVSHSVSNDGTVKDLTFKAADDIKFIGSENKFSSSYRYHDQSSGVPRYLSSSENKFTSKYSVAGHVLEDKLPNGPTKLAENKENNAKSYFSERPSSADAGGVHKSPPGWISPSLIDPGATDHNSSYRSQETNGSHQGGLAQSFEPPAVHPVLAKMATKRKRQRNLTTDITASDLNRRRTENDPKNGGHHNGYDDRSSKPTFKPPAMFTKFRAESFKSGSNSQSNEGPPNRYSDDQSRPPRISSPTRQVKYESDSSGDQSKGQPMSIYVMGRRVNATNHQEYPGSGTYDSHHRPPPSGEAAYGSRDSRPPPFLHSSHHSGEPEPANRFPWRSRSPTKGRENDKGLHEDTRHRNDGSYKPNTAPDSRSNSINYKFIEDTKKKLASEEWTPERDAELKRRVQRLLNREPPAPPSTSSHHRPAPHDASPTRQYPSHPPHSFSTVARHSSAADRYPNGQGNFNDSRMRDNSNDYNTPPKQYDHHGSSLPRSSSVAPQHFKQSYSQHDINSHNYRDSGPSNPQDHGSKTSYDNGSNNSHDNASNSYHDRGSTQPRDNGSKSFSGSTKTPAPVPPLDLVGLKVQKEKSDAPTELTKSARQYADELVMKYMDQKSPVHNAA